MKFIGIKRDFDMLHIIIIFFFISIVNYCKLLVLFPETVLNHGLPGLMKKAPASRTVV